MYFKSPEFVRGVCHLGRRAILTDLLKDLEEFLFWLRWRRAIGAGAKSGCATSQERDGCADCKELASKNRGKSVPTNQVGGLDFFLNCGFLSVCVKFIRKQDSNTVWCFKEIYSVAVATQLVEYYIRQANRY